MTTKAQSRKPTKSFIEKPDQPARRRTVQEIDFVCFAEIDTLVHTDTNN